MTGDRRGIDLVALTPKMHNIDPARPVATFQFGLTILLERSAARKNQITRTKVTSA